MALSLFPVKLIIAACEMYLKERDEHVASLKRQFTEEYIKPPSRIARFFGIKQKTLADAEKAWVRPADWLGSPALRASFYAGQQKQRVARLLRHARAARVNGDMYINVASDEYADIGVFYDICVQQEAKGY